MNLPEQLPIKKGIDPIAVISVLVVFIFVAGVVWMKVKVKGVSAVPYKASSQNQNTADVLEVKLLKDGSFILSGQAVPAVKLKDSIQRLSGSKGAQLVYLVPDPDTVYSRVVIALDLLRSFGITNIVLTSVRQ